MEAMKRLLALGMIIVLGLLAVFDMQAQAAGQPTISVESATGKVGKQVTVQVMMENNPGVTGVYLEIDYDSSKLRLVDAQDTGLLIGKYFSESYSTIPYALTWEDSLNPNNTKNGAIAKLTFEILKDCKNEEIRVSGSSGIVNYDLEFVTFEFQSGTIRTEGAAESNNTGSKPDTLPDAAKNSEPTADSSNEASTESKPNAVDDGHTHAYREKVTPPTCTEDGYTTHTCTLCGDSYTDTPVSALGHSYTEAVTPATCTEPGVSTFTCSRCRKQYSTSGTPPLGHDYEPAPSEGKRVYICTRCNARNEKKATASDYLLPGILAAALGLMLGAFFVIRGRRKEKYSSKNT